MKRILTIAALLIAAAVSLGAQDKVISFTASVYNEAREVYKHQWPFINTPVANMVKEASFVGEEAVMTLRDAEGDYNFVFFGTKGIVRNSRGGVMWGGSYSDYVKFPAIPGKALVKIELVSGKDYKKAPVIVREDGVAIEDGASVESPVTLDQNLVWELKNAPKGGVCKMVLNNLPFYGIRAIKLTYR